LSAPHFIKFFGTSANGWLRTSNFSDSEDEATQLTTARHLAGLIIDSQSCLYSQWFAGVDNVVSDALSHDFHLTDSHLTHVMQSEIPNQVPFGLKISQLPQEITSWLTCMLRNLPSKEQWSKEPTGIKLLLGTITETTCPPLDYQMTGSSTHSPLARNIEYSELSLTPSEKIDSVLQNLVKPLNLKKSEPPWIVWHRPVG
jgi:hypothetical protein